MEMPEGWNNSFYMDTSTDGGKLHIITALTIMKEMAEILEYTVNHGYGLNSKEKCLQILRKFNSW